MEYEKEDFLPIGHHLLPQEYQDFLYTWNKTITDTTGWWNGKPRKLYKILNPEEWAGFNNENKRLMILYSKEVAALKAYQSTYVEESSVGDSLPPLPPSPESNSEPETAASPQPDTVGSPVASPVDKLSRRLYNHPRWPSPLPKVFVQKLRGRNKWQRCDRSMLSTAWIPSFLENWREAGNTEPKLTHENCLRYLAYVYDCSIDEFLEKNPKDMANFFFGQISEYRFF